MTTFTDSAATFIDHADSSLRRRQLWEHFNSVGLPSTTDEVWRYAPLSGFSLDGYLVDPSAGTFVKDDSADSLARGAAIVIRVANGHLVDIVGSHDGVVITSEDPGSPFGDVDFEIRYGADSFALLNGALSPSALTITVAPGVQVLSPIIIDQFVGASSAFCATRIVMSRSSQLEVVECFRGGNDALVVPVAEFDVGENAELKIATYQRLADTAWHVARSTARLARDARVHQSVVGLGGHYDRARNDAEFVGTGARNELHTTFLGSGHQIHDLRTHQFHKVGRTSSVLLSKGAVADHSRSVYTGLIEIENGARRTDARQTNLNLLLAPTAHADTVPNLDIRENDVVCAHASSVGPLDELQRWYLESRGIDRDVAERLLVQGFFNEMTDSMPRSVAALVEADVARVLAATRLVSA